MAVSSASGSASSSPLTSMRMAWNVRLAGWPPVRRAGAGMAAVTISASSAVDSIGRAATMAAAMRRGEALVAVAADDAGELSTA